MELNFKALSLTKTEVSSFHLINKEDKRKLNVSLEGNSIQHNFTPRYLGVDLDRTLSFNTHLTRISQK